MIYLIGYLTIGCIIFLWTSIVRMRRPDKELVMTVSRNDRIIMREQMTMNAYWPVQAIVNITLWPIVLIGVIYLRIKRRRK